jgi:hypothetical protein
MSSQDIAEMLDSLRSTQNDVINRAHWLLKQSESQYDGTRLAKVMRKALKATKCIEKAQREIKRGYYNKH